jgi:hypothetical protein
MISWWAHATSDKNGSHGVYGDCGCRAVGAFKFRGAFNAIKRLDPSVETIITHSSGNHAQAIALAAKVGNKDHLRVSSAFLS